MPLLRSRTRIRRARLQAGLGLYIVLAVWTLGFAAIVIGHYRFGWW